MEMAPETSDWVGARARCSTNHTFALLVETVDTDVKAMHGIGNSLFELNRVAVSKIVVSRIATTGATIESVVFERTQTGVTIKKSESSAQPFLVAKVAVGFDGRCRYEVGGQLLELWQVSQKALEDLFFS